MIRTAVRLVALPIAALALGLPVRAQQADSAAFIIRLGLDTTAVERYVRTGNRIEAVSVSRSPRTVVRRLTVRLAPDGSVESVESGMQTGEMREVAMPRLGAIPLVGGFYLPWELALMRAFASGNETTDVSMLSGSQAISIPVQRLAPDRFALANQFEQAMQAHVDRNGRLQYLALDGGGATVERVRWLDIDALASEYAARDAAGRGLGVLSPTDTVTASLRGAGVSITYGRPALRGRDLRVLVPFDRLWRTGANNATELRTDQVLRIGDVTLQPGSYSLFTIPRADGWTLVVNRQTGQSGLAYDEAQDVGRVEMTVAPTREFVERFTILLEPAGEGGVLRLQWGGTEARAPIRVGG